MSKPKSEFVEQLDRVQAGVHAFLKPLGFRKKGRTHNRRTDGGLSHVVNFQMGAYPIGSSYVIPGFRDSYYGSFTVNLGVLLPIVGQLERQRAPKDFVQEYDCSIRARIGTLASGEDKWFEITSEAGDLAATVVGLLDRFGLEFFEQFKTYRDVLSYYETHGKLPFQTDGRASLEAALIAHHIGDEALARSLFAKAYAWNHLGFQQHVAELARRVGITLS